MTRYIYGHTFFIAIASPGVAIAKVDYADYCNCVAPGCDYDNLLNVTILIT